MSHDTSPTLLLSNKTYTRNPFHTQTQTSLLFSDDLRLSSLLIGSFTPVVPGSSHPTTPFPLPTYPTTTFSTFESSVKHLLGHTVGSSPWEWDICYPTVTLKNSSSHYELGRQNGFVYSVGSYGCLFDVHLMLNNTTKSKKIVV